MKSKITLGTVLLAIHQAILGAPSWESRWLEALAMVESGGRDAAVGAKGERSRYQIRRATWESHAKIPWSPENCRNPALASAVAQAHLRWLEGYYRRHKKKPASSYDLAVMWRMGANGYRKLDFRRERLPKRIRDYAVRVADGCQIRLERN